MDNCIQLYTGKALNLYGVVSLRNSVVRMLILTRRIGETIRIGDEVSITVLDAKGGGTKIGINAPKEISVHREEIYEKIARETQAGQQKRSQQK